MLITMKLAFGEQATLRLLNWLANENRRIFRYYDRRDEPLPGLYESGVRYQREKRETWCDYLALLAQGHEDCDGLSAARAGELQARGADALGPGDGGAEEAHWLGLRSIQAEVFMTTRLRPGQTGMYHCVTRYRVGDRIYKDDPSARLGMHDRRPRSKR